MLGGNEAGAGGVGSTETFGSSETFDSSMDGFRVQASRA